MPPRRVRLGPLDAIEFPAGPDNPVIVCFHGYGDQGAGLAFLGEAVRLPGPARWIFPDAPGRLPSIYGPGRAWFPLDESEVQRVQSSGETLDLAARRPAGLDEAAAAANEMLAALGVPWGRLILGGFSQGAMLALELALRAPGSPLGVFLLSGNLVDEPAVRSLAPARKGLRFFQSHGRFDDLLGFEGAQALEKVLVESGWEGKLGSFDGGHELPPPALKALGEFLGRLVETAPAP